MRRGGLEGNGGSCLVGCLGNGMEDVCDRVDQLPLFPYNRGWWVINPIVGVYIPIVRIPSLREVSHPQQNATTERPWHMCWTIKNPANHPSKVVRITPISHKVDSWPDGHEWKGNNWIPLFWEKFLLLVQIFFNQDMGEFICSRFGQLSWLDWWSRVPFPAT